MTTPTPLQAEKITDNVYWVGAIDWSVRNFHGYLTSRGTTYNAYLVLADKVTLIDTVKGPFFDEMMARIASVIDPRRIDYIVSNHSEMDHSGALTRTIDAVQPEKVFASALGVKALDKHFHLGEKITAVQNGSSLPLGNLSLTFVETRMVHWPDSMVSFLPERKLLFSQDAFGMHLASVERFDDELDELLLEAEARKYYANILLPLANVVTKAVDALAALRQNLELIAPDHGPIWRSGIDRVLEWYRLWGQQKPSCKAVIAYDTMWQSTALMARSIADGLRTGGVAVRVMPLDVCHRSDVATELLGAGALIVGSPTLNRNLLPTLADLLTYLRGLKPLNLIGAAFSSCGWHDEALGQINDYLRQMKVELINEGLSVQYVPDEAELQRCFELGQTVAEKLKQKCTADT